MKEYVLNGNFFKTRYDSHKYLKEKFSFPEFYGENLDALWDMLNELEEGIIYINNHEKIEENLGKYGRSLIRVFEDLNEEGRIKLVLK